MESFWVRKELTPNDSHNLYVFSKSSILYFVVAKETFTCFPFATKALIVVTASSKDPSRPRTLL